MRKGLDGLAMLVQGLLKQDPFAGHLFLFRGRKAELLKILWWDGTGLCLFTKRLEQSRFFWPAADETTGSVMLTQAQLSMLIEGVDWRSPEKRWPSRCCRLMRPIDTRASNTVRRTGGERSLSIWSSILPLCLRTSMHCIG